MPLLLTTGPLQVDWFYNRRLLEPIGGVPPAEFEALHCEKQEAPAMVAGPK